MPLENIVMYIARAMLMNDEPMIMYFRDHFKHMVRILKKTDSEEEWNHHETTCKECITYLLQYEMKPIEGLITKKEID
tara:strand:- start:175 stop:408 length:234 start_codon:yes stop_codon:yes gene_type:complete